MIHQREGDIFRIQVLERLGEARTQCSHAGTDQSRGESSRLLGEAQKLCRKTQSQCEGLCASASPAPHTVPGTDRRARLVWHVNTRAMLRGKSERGVSGGPSSPLHGKGSNPQNTRHTWKLWSTATLISMTAWSFQSEASLCVSRPILLPTSCTGREMGACQVSVPGTKPQARSSSWPSRMVLVTSRML